jgi:hypothetical protein
MNRSQDVCTFVLCEETASQLVPEGIHHSCNAFSRNALQST